LSFILDTSFFYFRNSLRRNPFIAIANGSKKKVTFLRLKLSNYRHQSLHKGHQSVGCRAKGEDIQKHANQFLKQAGGVLLQSRSNAA
jgi:hypothetical protein